MIMVLNIIQILLMLGVFITTGSLQLVLMGSQFMIVTVMAILVFKEF